MMKYRGAALALAILAVLVGLPSPAHAIVLFHIRGTVTDPWGRPLEGALVSDGRQPPVRTGPDGRYDIPEEALGRYTVTAKHGDTDDSSPQYVDRSVPLDADNVNFTLRYSIGGWVSNSDVSTASGPATRTATVTTKAPRPGTPGGSAETSCIYVTDSRTQQTALATFVSSSGSTSTWTAPINLSAGTPEATYSMSFQARDCASGTALTSTGSASYTVDNTAPTVPIETILPLDFGNTVFPTSQRIMARVYDAGSGVSASNSRIVVDDTTANTTAVITGSGLGLSNSWLRTAPRSLVDGHVYRVHVTAVDRAGNSRVVSQRPADEGGGFLATHVGTSLTKASIPITTCDLTAGSTPATKKATCANVPVKLDATTVTLGGSRHGPNSGFVEQEVPLRTVKVTTGGIKEAGISAFNSSDSAWSPKLKPMRFDVAGPFNGNSALPVPATTARINETTLTVEVPAAWQDAQIFMDAVDTTSSSTGACADPTVTNAALTCTPDPVASRYVFRLKDTTVDLAATEAAMVAGTGGSVDDSYAAGFRATLPVSAALKLARDARTGAAERFVAPTGTVTSAQAALAVTHFLTSELPEGLADLQDATVGVPAFLPAAAEGGLAAWHVPLIVDQATKGYAIVAASTHDAPVQRLAHGDLVARASARRAELEALSGQGVVSEQMRHVDTLTESMAFTLQDGRVVYVDLNATDINLNATSYVLAEAPPRGGNRSYLSQQRWAQLLGMPTTSDEVVICQPPIATGTNSARESGCEDIDVTHYSAESKYVPHGVGSANWNWYLGCSPTAGSMLMGYWSLLGFPMLMSPADYAAAQSDPDGRSPQSEHLIDLLRQYMGSTWDANRRWWGTQLADILPGIQDYEWDRGVIRYGGEKTNPKYKDWKYTVNTRQVPMVGSFIGWMIKAITPGSGYVDITTRMNHSVFVIGYYTENFTARDGKTYVNEYLIIHTEAKSDGDAIVAHNGDWSTSHLAYVQNNNI